MMAFLQQMRSPRLSFIQTVLSLFLGGMALMSSYWCVGQQKVPKPLCTPTKHSNCIPVPGVSNSNIQFSWETGDDRFVFPTFHTGLFLTCEENIYTDAWEEKCRGFYTLTPGSEKGKWIFITFSCIYVGTWLANCLKSKTFIRLCAPPLLLPPQSAWDGGPHDVHAGVSDHSMATHGRSSEFIKHTVHYNHIHMGPIETAQT
uniref:Germ cell-specific gene 1-like protein n=1 Tax=Dicentrarchus labrax TaxID=13489 RepID=A0A8P4G3W8_DICLA